MNNCTENVSDGCVSTEATALPTGAIIAIAVVVPVCVLLALAAVVYICCRRNKKYSEVARGERQQVSVTTEAARPSPRDIVHVSMLEDAPVVVITGSENGTTVSHDSSTPKDGHRSAAERLYNPVIRTDSKLVQNIANQKAYITRERPPSGINTGASRLSGRNSVGSRSVDSIGKLAPPNRNLNLNGSQEHSSFTHNFLEQINETQSTGGLDNTEPEDALQECDNLIRSASRENLNVQCDNEHVMDGRSRGSSISSLHAKAPIVHSNASFKHSQTNASNDTDLESEVFASEGQPIVFNTTEDSRSD